MSVVNKIDFKDTLSKFKAIWLSNHLRVQPMLCMLLMLLLLIANAAHAYIREAVHKHFIFWCLTLFIKLSILFIYFFGEGVSFLVYIDIEYFQSYIFVYKSTKRKCQYEGFGYGRCAPRVSLLNFQRYYLQMHEEVGYRSVGIYD